MIKIEVNEVETSKIISDESPYSHAGEPKLPKMLNAVDHHPMISNPESSYNKMVEGSI